MFNSAKLFPVIWIFFANNNAVKASHIWVKRFAFYIDNPNKKMIYIWYTQNNPFTLDEADTPLELRPDSP